MKRICHVCGKANGSCNRYFLANTQELVICPTCLAWSNDPKAMLARKAHKEKRLIEPK